MESLPRLSEAKTDRYVGYEKSVHTEIHVFCNASEVGYGACAYLCVGNDEQVNVSLLLGKSRIAPDKKQTIPRLELQTAVVAVRIGA